MGISGIRGTIFGIPYFRRRPYAMLYKFLRYRLYGR